jgi:hypothetical protein
MAAVRMQVPAAPPMVVVVVVVVVAAGGVLVIGPPPLGDGTILFQGATFDPERNEFMRRSRSAREICAVNFICVTTFQFHVERASPPPTNVSFMACVYSTFVQANGKKGRTQRWCTREIRKKVNTLLACRLGSHECGSGLL